MKLLVPILITPALAACCCLPLRSRRWMEWANLAGFAVTVGLGVLLLGQVLERQVVTECEEFFRADALSAWMVLLISIVSLGSSLYAGQYFSRDLAEGTLTPGRVKEFFILTPAFTTGMLLVVLANNLGVMWFALEATALSSVLLVALYNRRTSLEAAWKYVILGSLGLALALFGTVFIYAAAIVKASPVLPSFNWSHFMSVAPHLDHRMVKVAFVFVLVGYGTKAGLAPMHTWLPDAHSEAPSPTSAMLSGVSLKVALYALLRFHILTSASLESAYSSTLLLVFGLGSMCLAAPFILVQNNLKRLLAYSSLEHVGLICVGFGLNLPVTILGALLHMGYHALAKPVLFFAAGNIHQRCHTLEIRRMGGGLTRLLPWTVVCMAVAAAAATGLPPFGLFYSEMTVLNGGFLGGATWIGVVVVGAILASFCGILCQLSRVLLGGAKAPRTHSPIAPRLFGPQADSPGLDGLPAMGLMLSCLLLFSFWIPGSLFTLLRQAAAIVGGPA
jgi:hydrogenase-4 component F